MPIKPEELAYYRSNIIDKYVIEITTSLEAIERKLKRINKLRSNPNYKYCKCCKIFKPLTEFYKNPLKKQGVFDYCKECAIKRKKERYEANKKRKKGDKNA